MKIVLIGGGSFSWGPTFLRDIFTTPELRGSTIVLEDINPESLDLVYRLGQKMLADFHLDFRLEKTTDLDEALQGADIVVLSITTGGLASMRRDIEIPAKYGIRQSVGDTVGPGGLARALRNIPVVAAIARKVDEICPQALFMNYTNPMSVLTRAVAMQRSAPDRTVGLCHELIGVRKKLADAFKVDAGQFEMKVAGINHLIWIASLSAAGRDLWPDLEKLAADVLSGAVEIDAGDITPFADHFKLKSRLLQLYGALPAAGDRHVAEFFPNVLTEKTNWGEQYGIALTSVDFREGLAMFERTMIEASLSGDMPLDDFMKENSGEAVAPIAAALATGGKYTGIMNLPNVGQINNLPYNAIVETFGVIDASGAHALPFGDLPPGVQTIVERHIRNQEMTVTAALTGDRRLALQALLNDPLSSLLEVDSAAAMMDELLAPP
jgi:alpha-galactosidase